MKNLEEARAKQAVSGGKVQKYITGFGLKLKGKKYEEVDFELMGIDNASQIVTLRVLPRKGHPSDELKGQELKVPFKMLRRGPFMATDMSKDNVKEEMTTTASAGIPQDTKNMGPRFRATDVTDRRRRKDRPPLLLKRFRKYVEDNDAKGETKAK